MPLPDTVQEQVDDAIESEFDGMIVYVDESGVNILMGSDAGNPSIMLGYCAHKELNFMVEGGMTNAEALRSATIALLYF